MSVKTLSNSVSDHHTILIGLEGFKNTSCRFGKRFHYEEVWEVELECENIVERIWNSRNIPTLNIEGVSHLLSNCATSLTNWNKYTF